MALLLAYLIHGRSVRSRRLQDLLLAQGLLMLAVASLGLAFLGEALAGLGRRPSTCGCHWRCGRPARC